MLEIALLVITSVGTFIFTVIAYAYKKDMGYLKERMTEISVNTQKRFDEDHEDNKERFELVHKRIDGLNDRVRENEAIINKELK